MNLTEFFNQEGKTEQIVLNVPISSFHGNELKEASSLQLVLTNIGKGKVKVEGKATLTFSLPCDRCLKPVDTPVVLDFSRTVLAPELLTDEDEKQDQLFVEEYDLNAENLLSEELQISWPCKVLCKEECKGICTKCGQNLNEGSCECDDFVPDIRFANLMDIFNGNQ